MITEDRFYGGSVYHTGSTNYTMHPNHGRAYAVNITTAGKAVTLPDARELQKGQHYYIVNINNPPNSLAVKDNAGGTVVAGMSNDQIHHIMLFDNSTQAGVWEHKAVTSVPAPAQYPHIFGGNPTDRRYETRKYDISGNSWSLSTSSPGPYVHGVTLWFNSRCNVIGYTPTELFSKANRQYRMDHWTTKTDCTMHVDRSAAAAAYGKGYIFGSAYTDYETSCVEYSQADSWTTKGNVTTILDQQHTAKGVGVDSQLIFATEGYDTDGPPYNTNKHYQYAATTDTWTEKTTMPATPYRARHTSFVDDSGDKYHVVMGDDGSAVGDNDEYDVSSNAWTSKTGFGAGRQYPAGFSAEGDGYFAGGSDSFEVQMPQVRQYDFTGDSWSVVQSLANATKEIAHLAAPLW